MGPQISALLILPALFALGSIAFIVAHRLHPTSLAIRLAALFVVGVAAGSVLAVAAFALLFGVGDTLASRSEVIAFISALAACGLAGGALLPWACIKLRVLTLCSTGPS
jgi:hypothetical protein